METEGGQRRGRGAPPANVYDFPYDGRTGQLTVWHDTGSAFLHAELAAIAQARKRILLLYSIVLSIGGIPLLYLGDEVGTLKKLQDVLENLSQKEMQQVVDLLQRARTAGGAKTQVADAYTSQKKLVVALTQQSEDCVWSPS